jgi:hypothetical protein
MIPTFGTMHRHRAHTPQRARRSLGLVFAGALLAAACALAVAPAAASARAPLIGPVGANAGPYGEGLIETQIDPEGQETIYWISADCELPALCQHAGGTLPADEEEHPISLKLTGLKPGVTYHFDIYATSSAGEMNWPGEFTAPVIPPGAYPEGSPGQQYEPPEISKASLEFAEQKAELTFAKTEAERHQAKEQEEQKKAAAMAAIRATEAAALKHKEEEEAQEAAAREAAEQPACIVPALKGDTLTVARRALAKAHCRLGAIHELAHRHGALRVSAQGAPAGEQFAHGARVTLALGAKRASRRGSTR